MGESAPEPSHHHSEQHSEHHGEHHDDPSWGPADLVRRRAQQRADRRARQLAAALRATGAMAAGHRTGPQDRTASPDLADLADLADRLCVTAAAELGAQGVTLCALFAPGMSVPVGVNDPTAARAEEVQFSAGEGPCWLAYASGAVVVADLSDPVEAERLQRLWPAYAPALRCQTGYAVVVGLPLRLAAGLQLVLNIYAASAHRDRWWQAAPVVADALREVLDAASPPMAQGGPVWLDSSSTLRRGAVWVAETLLVDEDPSLDPARALGALRTFAVVEGVTVDAAAAALVRGHLSAGEVLGRA